MSHPDNSRAAMEKPHVDLDRILIGTHLPALPQSAVRLLELSKDPENGPAEFAIPIEADPGLTSQVLRFVNSSYFGFAQEISNVKLAITLVGVRTIKNFALWSAVFSLMPNPMCGPLVMKHLWQDSLRRALFARAIGRLFGLEDIEGPFTAALLQDLAVPLLAKELKDDYVMLLEQRAGGESHLSDLEREHFGWTHAEAGAQIVGKWNLPEEFSRLIERHSDLVGLLQEPQSDSAQLAVALSALLPACSDESWVEYAQLEAAYEKLTDDSAPLLIELLTEVDEQFSDFAPVLDLSIPTSSLVECYEQVASQLQ